MFDLNSPVHIKKQMPAKKIWFLFLRWARPASGQSYKHSASVIYDPYLTRNNPVYDRNEWQYIMDHWMFW